MTDDIAQDTKDSSIAVGGAKLAGCFLCTYRRVPIYKHITARVIKCPECIDYLAVFEHHCDQQLNMPWLISTSHKVGEKFFGGGFVLDFSNGEFHEDSHLYLHIRRKFI